MTVSISKKTLLLIDDDPDITTVLQSRLEHAGYSINIAHSGRDGLRKAKVGHPPDLIILDITLGDMTGYEVCAAIKTDHPQIPVILLTSHIRTIDEHLGYACKADAYIRKPHSGERLLPEIEKQLDAAAHSLPDED